MIFHTAAGFAYMIPKNVFSISQEISLKSHPDDVGYYLKGFGQDNDGEIYLAVSSMLGPQGNTGKVYKLVAARDKNFSTY